MSFGFSVGDFIAIGKLTIQLYNACASAPSEFQELRRDLSSIHTVIYGLQSQADDPNSLLRRRCDDRRPEWETVKENLEGTLLELQDLLGRYKKMGRNAWQRVRLGFRDLNNLRGKLSVHLSSINAFVGSLSLSALGRMEPALGRIECLLIEFVKEERRGNRAPTVLSAHEEGSGPAWKQMKFDLLLGGISREDFERNEERIRELLDWVVNNERDLVDLKAIEVGESISQRQSFENVATPLRSKPEDAEDASPDLKESHTNADIYATRIEVDGSSFQLMGEIVNTIPVPKMDHAQYSELLNPQTHLFEATKFNEYPLDPGHVETGGYSAPGKASERRMASQISPLDSNKHLSKDSNLYSPLVNESQNDTTNQAYVLARFSIGAGLSSQHPSTKKPTNPFSMQDPNSMNAQIEKFEHDRPNETAMAGVEVIAAGILEGSYLKGLTGSMRRGDAEPCQKTLQLIIESLQHTQTVSNVSDMLWTIIQARWVELLGATFWLHTSNVHIFGSALSELICTYQRKMQPLHERDGSIAVEKEALGRGEIVLTAAEKIPIKILIIDHEVSHFGFMFEGQLRGSISQSAVFQIHHYSSNLANNSKLTQEDQKYVLRTQAAWEKYRRSRRPSQQQHLGYPYRRPGEGYLRFFEYNFIILVQPRSGAYQDSHLVNTPFGAAFGGELASQLISYSALRESGIVFDALRFADDRAINEKGFHRPYSKYPVKTLEHHHYIIAKDQISYCVKRFLCMPLGPGYIVHSSPVNPKECTVFPPRVVSRTW